MKKITLRKIEYIQDVRYYDVEISSEDFPEILNEDFSIENMSDEMHDELGGLDWDFVNDKAMSPDVEYRIKE